MSFTRELEIALDASLAAARRIRELYSAGFDVAWKGVNDPVTTADREANALLVGALGAAFPADGICAEENAAADSSAAAARGGRCWFVDPLDGTRDFVGRTGEFCVMTGLAVDGVAVLGVVVSPLDGVAWTGVVGEGAFRVDPGGTRSAVHPAIPEDVAAARLVVSRSHADPTLASMAAALGITTVRAVGSVGLKVACVVSGSADLYVHAGRGMKLWDACAPEAIARAAGLATGDATGGTIGYCTSDLAVRRGFATGSPAHVAAAVRALAEIAPPPVVG